MDGIELAVVCVVRVEDKIDEPVCVASLGGEFMKKSRLAVISV